MESVTRIRKQMSEMCVQARSLETQNELEKALTLYQEALAFAEKNLGVNMPESIELVCVLGRVALKGQHYNEAQNYFLDARSRLERALYAEHNLYQIVNCGLADLYFEMDLYAEAHYFYQQAKKLLELQSSQNIEEYPRLIARCGDCCRMLLRVTEAEELYGQLLLHYEKTNFQNLDTSKKLLARMGTAEFEEFKADASSIGFLQEAHDIISGGGCLDFHFRADLCAALGETMQFNGQTEEASSQLQEAYRLHSEHHGAMHGSLLSVLRGFLACVNQGSSTELISSLYQKLLSLMENKFGEDSREIVDIYIEASATYSRCGFSQDAYQAMVQAINAFEKAKVEDPAMLAGLYYEIGIVALHADQFEDAERHLLKSLTMQKQLYGPQNESVAACLTALGTLHDMKNEESQALQYFNLVLQMRGKVLQESNPLLQRATQFMVKLAGIKEPEKKEPPKKEPEKKEVSPQDILQVPEIFKQAVDKIATNELQAAVQLLEKLVAILEGTNGTSGKDLVPALQQLVIVREKLGQSQLVTELRNRIQSIQK